MAHLRRLGAKIKGRLPLALPRLATSGALPAPDGTFAINWEKAGRDRIVKWTDRGGPEVEPPEVVGLGAAL